jgi:hypothetical protein
MTIEHDFFGILGSDDEGEVYWSDTAELGEESVDIDLNSPDEASVSVEALDIAAAMINALEEIDARAKESLVAELTADGTPTSLYITEQLDDLDPEALENALIWDSGDKQIDFLRSMRLQRVGFHPHHIGSDENFAILDYSISPDETDSLLVVMIDVHGDAVGVVVEN